MVLKSLGDKSSGTSIIALLHGIIGGVLISTDGTNAATVQIKKAPDGVAGSEIIFDLITVTSSFICAPIVADGHVQLVVSGTGAYAQLFEWIT